MGRPGRPHPSGRPSFPPGESAAGLIAPVIPWSPGRPATGAARRAGTVSRLPLAGSPPGSPPAPGDVVYGIGRIDASGRVTDRAVARVLGWRGGDRLTLTAGAGVVIARRDPGGVGGRGWTSPPRRRSGS